VKGATSVVDGKYDYFTLWEWRESRNKAEIIIGRCQKRAAQEPAESRVGGSVTFSSVCIARFGIIILKRSMNT